MNQKKIEKFYKKMENYRKHYCRTVYEVIVVDKEDRYYIGITQLTMKKAKQWAKTFEKENHNYIAIRKIKRKIVWEWR